MANATSAEGWDLSLSTTEIARSETDLASLVETYAALLFRVAHSIVRNPVEAEDIVQDVFVRVLQHRHKLPDIRDLRVWLVRIAWNLALDRRRIVRPEQLDPAFASALVAGITPADQALGEARQIAIVFTLIETLPKYERSALLLSAVDELSIAEIAAILAKTESAIRALLFRARTHLRQRLEKGKIK